MDLWSIFEQPSGNEPGKQNLPPTRQKVAFFAPNLAQTGDRDRLCVESQQYLHPYHPPEPTSRDDSFIRAVQCHAHHIGVKGWKGSCCTRSTWNVLRKEGQCGNGWQLSFLKPTPSPLRTLYSKLQTVRTTLRMAGLLYCWMPLGLRPG